MINRVILVGRITKEPELRTTGTGVNVLSFTLAFDNKTKNADRRHTNLLPRNTLSAKTIWRKLKDER